MIEDTPAGLEAARTAGMRAIGISGTYPLSELRSANYTVTQLNALYVTVRPADEMIEIFAL